MTKHIARLVVTILILATLGYVGYTYIFTPDVDQHVYTNTFNLLEEYFNDNSIKYDLEKLNNNKYYGSEGSKKLISGNSNLKSSHTARLVMFGAYEDFDEIYGEVERDNNTYGMVLLMDDLNKTAMHYATYSQFAKNVTKSDYSKIDNLSNQLKSLSKSMESDIDNLIRRQKSNSEESAVFTQINSEYLKLFNKTKSYIDIITDLNISLKDFIIKKAYGNNFIFDNSSILSNTLFYTAKNIALEDDYTMEELLERSESFVNKNKRLYDTYIVQEAYQQYNSIGFTEEGGEELTRLYNDLVINANAVLFGENNFHKWSLEDKRAVKTDTKEGRDLLTRLGVPTSYHENMQFIITEIGY